LLVSVDPFIFDNQAVITARFILAIKFTKGRYKMIKIQKTLKFFINAILLITLNFANLGSGATAMAASADQAVIPGGQQANILAKHPSASLNSAPLMFIENVGQWSALDSGARFQVRGTNSTIWLSEDAVWVTLLEEPAADPTAKSKGGSRLAALKGGDASALASSQKGINLKISYPGANPHPRLEAFNRLDTHVSYFIGNDPSQWHADVPVWGGVRYKDLYPGIDLEISGENGQLAQRLVLRQRAQLDSVQLRVDGADSLSLDGNQLRLETALGTYTLPLLQLPGTGTVKLLNPKVLGGQVISPFADPQAKAADVTIQSGASDLLYSTFLGGIKDEYSYNIAVDVTGAVYVAGSTFSPNFPTGAGFFDPIFGGSSDAFVAKLNPSGSALTYVTFLGGSGMDEGNAIAINVAGAAFIVGDTESYNFPTTSAAFDKTANGSFDIYIAKLNPLGSALMYATYLGGSEMDLGSGLAVDAIGAAYILGTTFSPDFPATPGAFDTSLNEAGVIGIDNLVVKINVSGSALSYATYLGGSNAEFGYSIVIDRQGSAYITGSTDSSDFPVTPGAFSTDFKGSYEDAFVTKLNASGSALTYSTFLGGTGDNIETGVDIAVDPSGEVFVAGYTDSIDFPVTPGAFDTSFNSIGGGSFNDDVFVAKLNATGSALIYATYLGGQASEEAEGLVIDSSGAAYIIGYTRSTDFPTTPGAFDTGYNGGYDDGFVVKLNPGGSGLAYATLLGGSQNDAGGAIAINSNNVAYIAGETSSSDFPVTSGAFDTSQNGSFDAFIAKLAVGGTPTKVASILRTDPNPSIAASLRFTVNFSEAVSGVDPADFSLTATGITGAAVTGVSGSGTKYIVTVSTGSGFGSLSLNLIDNDTIIDLAGNALGGTGPGNGNFSAGSKYTLDRNNQFTSAAALDGWMLESAENTNLGNAIQATTVLVLGDDAANKQYRALLSFPTSGVPDNATIVNVTLKIKKGGVVGTDPFTSHGSLWADIRKGFFGTLPALQAADFQAPPSGAAGVFSAVSGAPGWYQLVLTAANYKYINLAGTTQFRLRFATDDNNDHGADYAWFYAGEAAADSRPVLIVDYTLP
jgi:hypothetical protein